MSGSRRERPTWSASSSRERPCGSVWVGRDGLGGSVCDRARRGVRPGGGARARHHSPRPQAGEHLPVARWSRQDPRLRFGRLRPRRGPEGLRSHRAGDDGSVDPRGCGPGHGRLHVARAGRGPAGRCALGSLLARSDRARDAERQCSLPACHQDRIPPRDPQRPARGSGIVVGRPAARARPPGPASDGERSRRSLPVGAGSPLRPRRGGVPQLGCLSSGGAPGGRSELSAALVRGHRCRCRPGHRFSRHPARRRPGSELSGGGRVEGDLHRRPSVRGARWSVVARPSRFGSARRDRDGALLRQGPRCAVVHRQLALPGTAAGARRDRRCPGGESPRPRPVWTRGRVGPSFRRGGRSRWEPGGVARYLECLERRSPRFAWRARVPGRDRPAGSLGSCDGGSGGRAQRSALRGGLRSLLEGHRNTVRCRRGQAEDRPSGEGGRARSGVRSSLDHARQSVRL